jgi:hypothetical protein
MVLFLIPLLLRVAVIAGVVVVADLQFNLGISDWVMQQILQILQNHINPF